MSNNNNDIINGLRNVVMVGVGAVATAVDKVQEAVPDLIKRGEQTVKQGKEMNDELKRSVKETIKENVTVTLFPKDEDELRASVSAMSKEERDHLMQILKDTDDAENGGSDAE